MKRNIKNKHALYNLVMHRIFIFLGLICLLINVAGAVVACYRLSKIALPLASGPKFLKLHAAACFERLPSAESGVINDDCLIVDSDQPPYVLLDFLPLDPTNSSTLGTLLSGARVPGEIRSKARAWPTTGLVIGSSRMVNVDLDDVVANLNATYDASLKLVGNNCHDFVDRVFDSCPET